MKDISTALARATEHALLSYWAREMYQTLMRNIIAVQTMYQGSII